MNERGALALPSHTYFALCAYARASGRGDPDQLAAEAITSWLADMRRDLAPSAGESGHGYRWKSLFLPEGTRLRPCRAGGDDIAVVIGDAIVFHGTSVSPNQLLIATSGKGYNAWNQLLVRFPGEPHWKLASVLRRALAQREAAPPPPSPMQVMMDASASMSEVLRNALAVIDESRDDRPGLCERRAVRQRRADDMIDVD